MRPFPIRLLSLAALGVLTFAVPARPAELVEIDSAGVIRWRADQREVALFGANYCLPSASDYRAAKKTAADLPKLIEQDLTHFARMGWDAARLSFWGDWENSDREGNLIANEHLDLLDRTIAECKRRGIYILFSPITNHASWWPDSNVKEAPDGFSKFFEKSKLGTDPKAIAVQANYLKQILNHVNPHTGVALKDEPQILFVELINEPWHHSDDRAGSIAYINALVEAIRSTGCEKLLFHNVSQDFGMAPIIRDSKAQGVTFGWYPTNLINGHTLQGNHLRSVDDYAPMRVEALRGFPSLVYEFDSADQAESTMYPAMVRTFRSVGAQFATMFSYDMLATAPYNLGWQTHVLNLVHSPRKAVASVIAGEAMRRLPRGENYGAYPGNKHFGPFRIDEDANLAELVLPDVFLHAGDTTTLPPGGADKLKRIVGLGSSPVVSYEGLGAYFLDSINANVWRLEVYPDAVNVLDPFAQKQNSREPSVRLLERDWPMTIRLPSLGNKFHAQRLDGTNFKDSSPPMARDGTIRVRPGIYLLGRLPAIQQTLGQPGPEAAFGQLRLREFVIPPISSRPPQVVHQPRQFHASETPLTLAFEVVSETELANVTLHVRGAAQPETHAFPLPRGLAYRHETTLPVGTLPEGAFAYHVTAERDGTKLRFPAEGIWASRIFPASATLVLLHGASVPLQEIAVTESRLRRDQQLERLPKRGNDDAAIRFRTPDSAGRHHDHSLSRNITSLVAARGPALRNARELSVRYRAARAGWTLSLSLVERDGTTWSAELPEAPEWSERTLQLADFRVGRGVQLPTGYPGNWNYWRDPAAGRGGPEDRVRLDRVEHVQFSFRAPADAGASLPGASLDLDSLSVVNP